MEKRSFIQSFVWSAGGALLMILFLLLYGTFGHLLNNGPVFPHAALTIQPSHGPRVSLDVEVASSAQEKTYGLMFRRSLPERSGMLFIWKDDQSVSFWMKNTPLSLDMLFVRYDGVIVKIATHTEPFSLRPIPSGEPIRGVIEINGGTAERLGIETGDKVLFPAFSEGP